MKNNHRFLRIVLVIFLVISINLLFYQQSYAFTGFGGKIFGKITICVGGFLLNIGPPVGGLFLLPFGAKIYAFYTIAPGAWTLGTYGPGGACVAPDGCVQCPPIPTQGTIIMMGTS
ncbi:MAG: hypothetical protein AAB595_01345 [Patescibacteria group bacterium]